MSLSERSAAGDDPGLEVPGALGVPCRGCTEPVGKPCRTPSGYELKHTTHDVRQVDVARAQALANGQAFVRMVETAKRHRDEVERLRNLIGELYMQRGDPRHRLQSAIRRTFRNSQPESDS